MTENTHPDPLQVWSSVAPAWESYRERVFNEARPVSDWLVEQIDPKPGQTVLEVTAGPGETGFLVAPRLAPGGRLISSDFSPEMVEAAKRGAAAKGIDNVDCLVLDVQQIDLPDSSVDAVLSRFGLMLVPEQEKAIGEIRRVLKAGGRGAYATWGPPDRNPWIFQIVMALLQNGVAPPGDPFAAGGVFSLADAERNLDLAKSAGFDNVDIEELSGVMRFSDPDDYWTFNTAMAGPVAQLVGSLSAEQIAAIRKTLDASLAPFEKDGGLELPWVTIGTSIS